MSTERHIRIRVAVTIVRDSKILLVQHEKHGRRYWLLPGGGLEYGETAAECGARELMEETGLEVQVGDLFFISESIPPDGHRHVLNLYYQGMYRGGTIVVGQDDVLRDAQWVDLADLPHLTLYPAVTREVLEALEGHIPQRSLGKRWE